MLDTNVLSAVMCRETDPLVITWLDNQPPQSIWTTAITVFEIRFDLEIMVNGPRRRQLEETFAKALEGDLDDRVVPFDQPAALAGGIIAAEQRRQSRPAESVTSRSPVSPPRARRLSPHGMSGISRALGLLS